MRIGRLFGIDIVVDWSWLVMMLLLFTLLRDVFDLRYPQQATAMAAACVAGFFLSVLIHELSHSLMAKARHLTVTRIRLYIFGGASELGTDTASPFDEFVVTAVGPGSSFALAGLGWGIGQSLDGAGAVVAGYLGWLNLTLAVFNIVPAFPLDGGRILRAVVWGATTRRDTGTLVSARAGQVLGVLLVAGGIYRAVTGEIGEIWYAFIGWMIFSAANSALQGLRVNSTLAGAVASQLMWDRPLAVHPEEALARVAWMLEEAPHPAFPVVTEDGRVVGMVSAEGIAGRQGRVQDATERLVSWVHPDTPGPSVLEALGVNGREVVVIDHAGHLLGMVTPASLEAALRAPRSR